MAITAKFEADFESFHQAVQNAQGDLSALAGGAADLGKKVDVLVGGLKAVAGAVGVSLSAKAAIDFVNHIGESALALRNLSLQTQINVTDLQILAAATNDYGIDAEQLGRAVFGLSQRLAGGDASAASGLHRLGLSLEDVKKKNGMDLFLTIERGLGTLQGSLRDTAAADLFGARVGAAMGAFSTGVDTAIEKTKEMTIANEESVMAMAAFTDTLDRMWRSLLAMATNAAGPVAQGLNTLVDAVGKGASKWQIFNSMMADTVEATLGLNTGTEHLTALIDAQNKKTEAGTAATRTHTVALTEQQQIARFMASLEADASKALTGSQLKNLAHLKAIGELNAKNAGAIGVNVAQFEKYQASLAKSETAAKKLADANKEINSAGADWQGTLATINDTVFDSVVKFHNAGVSMEALGIKYNLTGAQVKSVSLFIAEQAEIEKRAAGEAKKLAEATEEINSAGADWQGTLATINGTVLTSVRRYLEAGVSQEALARKYGLTAAQIKSVTKFMGEQLEMQKRADRAIEETKRLWSDYDQLLVERGGKATDIQIAAIHRWADDLKEQMVKAGSATVEFYEALDAVTKEKLKQVKTAWDEAWKNMGKKIEGHLAAALKNIPQLFIDAFTGGGGVMGALKGIGVSLLDAITKEIFDPLMDQVAKFAVKYAKVLASAFGVGGGGGTAGAVASGAASAGGSAAGAAGAGGGAAAAGGLASGLAMAGGIGLAGWALYDIWKNSDIESPIMGGKVSGGRGPLEGGAPMTIADLLASQRGTQVDGTRRMASGGMGRVTNPTLFLAGEAGSEEYAFSGGGKKFSGKGDNTALTAALAGLSGDVAGLRRDFTFTIPTLIAKATATALAKAGVGR